MLAPLVERGTEDPDGETRLPSVEERELPVLVPGTV